MQLTLEESNLLEALSRYPDLIDDLKALNILENLVARKRLVKNKYAQDPWDPGMFDPYLITYSSDSSEGKNS